MIILGIDTTSTDGSIALLRDGADWDQAEIHSSSDYARQLLPALDLLLQRNKASISQVDRLAAVVGPGSFTGLRVGLATAKALAQSRGKAVAGFSALEVLAFAYRKDSPRVAPWLDAGRGQIYAAVYQSADLALVATPVLDLPEKVIERMDRQATLVVGSGAALFGHHIALHSFLKRDASVRNLAPALCRMAWQYPERVIEAAALDGLYIRPGNSWR